MTISQAHRERLRDLHRRDPNFGVIGHRWADRLWRYMLAVDARTLLDYGAGRSGLAAAVKAKPGVIETHEYEPAFGHLEPSPHDFVSCIDVMEHVEKDQVDAVLTDIRRCARKGALITISLRNASQKKRATHPMVKPREWWLQTIGIAFAGPYKIEEVPILDVSKAKSEIAILITRVQ